MLFNKIFKALDYADIEEQQLNTSIINTVNSFINHMNKLYNDPNITNKSYRYISAIEQFNNYYKDFNKKFRKLYGKINDNVHLFNKAYNKHSLVDMVKNKFPNHPTKECNKCYIKFAYTDEIVVALLREHLSLMYAKYKDELKYYQIAIGFVKVIIEYLEPNEVIWNQVFIVMNDYYITLQYEEIQSLSEYYGVKIHQRKSNLKYKTKHTELIDDIFRLLSEGMKKKDVCKILNINERTLYRLINGDKYPILSPFKKKIKD